MTTGGGGMHPNIQGLKYTLYTMKNLHTYHSLEQIYFRAEKLIVFVQTVRI